VSMGNAYFEFGDLTAKIGDQVGALAALRKGLAIRREIASELGADAEKRIDVARSLNVVATTQEMTGDVAGRERCSRRHGR
jgi:hypothetical protein